MRAVAGILAALVLAGCGASKTKPAAQTAPRIRGDSYPVTLRPATPVGRWVKLFLSPDLKTWLGQWSGECEVQTAYFVPVRGGEPRPVTGNAADESIALGWAGRRARVLMPRAACGRQFRTPGIYLVDPRGGKPILAKKIRSRPGGA